MIFTNHAGLPIPLYEALVRGNWPPDITNKRISVTQLIKPARILRLEGEHWAEVVEDCSERLWAMLGTTVHKILERSKPGQDEREIEISRELHGWTVLGHPDRLTEDGVIEDYKITSAWSVKFGKDEWVQQLNIYRWLLAPKKRARGLRIWAILRDWSKREAERSSDYPQRPIVRLTLPMWPDDKTEAFITARIAAHTAEALPECTPEERWARGGSWAVKRDKGAKTRATIVAKTQEEAERAVQESYPQHIIEHRPGRSVRCEQYCRAAPFCEQWKRERAESEAV